MTAFRVGMKVAALKGKWTLVSGDPSVPWLMPESGEIYTIESTMLGSDGIYLFLEELGPGRYHSKGFRPIVSRPTSIAVFQAMLTGKKAGVEA